MSRTLNCDEGRKNIKRNAILFFILLVFLVGISFGIFYLNNPDIFHSSKGEVQSDAPLTYSIEYPVNEGEVFRTYSVDAAVISNCPEIYIFELRVDGIKDTNFEILKNKGDYIAPNESIYAFKGKEKSVDYHAQIVDIRYSLSGDVRSVTITLLNYDMLYIVAEVSAEIISEISYETKVVVLLNGEEYMSEIMQIGYEISDRKVPVHVVLPAPVLPGTEANLTFMLGIKQHGLFVSEDALYTDGDYFYGNLKTEDSNMQVQIEIGQRFSVEEDGNLFRYIEVLSGVREGDVLIVEKMIDIGPKIKESLINE
ncbi:MAG: hypothetical protein PHP22_09220 [Oscillospiraceae bacterium]|nr:hypothetical protein [Oscillospiraceae bacterium]